MSWGDDMADQLVRFIAAARLIGRPQGATTKDLAKVLQVSPRTAFRLVRKIEAAGFPLYDEQDGHEKIWHLNWNNNQDGLKPDTSLTAEEQAILGVMISQLGEVASLSQWSHSLLKKLQYVGAFEGSFLNPGGSHVIEISRSNVAKVSRTEDASYVITLLSAISKHHTCTVVYKAPGPGPEKQYPVYPLSCFVASGGMYLYCVIHSKGNEYLSMLAIERIKDLRDDGTALFEPIANYDVKSLLEDPFGIILENEWIDVEVVLDAKKGWYETQRQWPRKYVDYRLRPDGTWAFRIHTRGKFGLLSWMLTCAEHVLGISNEAVKKSYVDMLANQMQLLRHDEEIAKGQ